MKLTENARFILNKRYLLKDENGDVYETPTQLFRRVAKAIAVVEVKYGKSKQEVKQLENDFYKMMINLEFLPNSPTLMNSGTSLGMLSACLSIDTELLTKYGWVNAETHHSTEDVLTFNKETKKLEFQEPITKIEKISETMIHFKNRTLDMLVTPDHSMLYRYRICGNHGSTLLKNTAENLIKHKDSSIGIPLTGEYDFPIEQTQNLSLDDCELLGWIFTDGHLCKGTENHKDNGIIIAQTLHCEKLERCLNACKVIWTQSSDKYRIHTESAKKYRDILFQNKSFQWAFLLNLTKAQMISLWYGIYWGDSQKREGSYAITQEDQTRRDQIQIIAILLGKSAHYTINSRGKHIINVCDHKSFAWFMPKKHCSIVNEPQKVWCVQVPNGNIVIRRNGKIAIVGNCFVLPIEDDIDAIFSAIKYTAKIHKAGGGTGFSFSRLRPRDDIVKSTGGIASGPLSFMTVFDATTEVIKQGGKRRGANMGILRIDHPDIMDFIVSKEREQTLTNFNLSVAITDKFMKAIQEDGDFELINPRNKKVSKTIKARALWNLLCLMSWKNGEPAIIFIDTINKANPTPEIGEIESTNPCGEVPLLPYESCNLGSIVISKFVKKGNGFDWEKLRKQIRLAIRFLDNVIDANKFPLLEIRDMTLANRKIGLGVMGWADALLSMGVRYDSEKALQFAEKLMKFIHDEGFKMSQELGMEKGNFPNKDKSIFKEEPYLRNATITSVAPTGTISIIAGASYGIEPIFSIVTTRNTQESLGKVLVEVNPAVKRSLELKGIWNEELENSLLQGQSKCLLLPKDIKDVLVTAHQITPEWHVKMQAAFQKYTDNSISKTVNLPENANTDTVEMVYQLAYKLGCKGITVYRDQSRTIQLLTKNDKCMECATE